MCLVLLRYVGNEGVEDSRVTRNERSGQLRGTASLLARAGLGGPTAKMSRTRHT